jgi:hypothetical protein
MSHTLHLAVAILMVASSAACSSSSVEDDTTDTSSAPTDMSGNSSPGEDTGTSASMDTGPPPLIDHTEWTAANAEEDPFGDRPASVDCKAGLGWTIETLELNHTLTVDTNECNYLTAMHPLGRDLAAGTPLEVRLWHFELQGSGESHVAVRVGEELILDKRIPIPSQSQLVDETIPLAADRPAGTPVYFHVHNHGNNTYNFIGITAPGP